MSILTSDEQLKGPKPLVFTDKAYNALWIERTKARCIVDSNGCWLWTGTRIATGYSRINYKTWNHGGHRLMYQAYHGIKLETEQYVLHRCDVRNCVNPAHLWIGTAKDNNRDCAAKSRHFEGSKMFCDKGHPLSGDNLRISQQHPPKIGIRRICIACEMIRRTDPEARKRLYARQKVYREKRKRGASHV